MTKNMKTIMCGAVALAAMITVPAQAQLLGGGGLGGMVGGGVGGMIGGTLGGSDLTGGVGRLGSSLSGTVDGAGSANASHSVDRRKGKASASGAANGSLGTAAGNTAAALTGSASGGADAQLVGTDAVRSAAGTARSTVGQVIAGAQTAASGAAAAASGSASGTANGTGRAGIGQLALAGSAAANAAGSFDVAPGMVVRDMAGKVVGSVADVRTTAQGAVQSVVMEVGNGTATLPAANFSGSGNVLLSAMTRNEVKQTARQQNKSTTPSKN
ncbi:hypothetical protein [Rhizorhabdus sp.]|uniref:hypothetical protein n=1 Tax=Rhizorhabdus sp. TaxID=1968843 RepID=UPI0035B1D182